MNSANNMFAAIAIALGVCGCQIAGGGGQNPYPPAAVPEGDQWQFSLQRVYIRPRSLHVYHVATNVKTGEVRRSEVRRKHVRKKQWYMTHPPEVDHSELMTVDQSCSMIKELVNGK